MSDTKTLDDRIRAAAMKAARKELEAKIAGLMNFKTEGTNTPPFGWEKMRFLDRDVDLDAILSDAADAYLEKQSLAIGDLAIRKFMDKVDKLQEEVSEIMDAMEGLPRGD